VNGRTVDRPSYRLRRGDVVSVASKSRALAQGSLESGAGMASDWITVDREGLKATMASFPDEAFLPFPLEPRLIIEHYSRAM
jgi:small subunit ribosomal protein S4